MTSPRTDADPLREQPPALESLHVVIPTLNEATFLPDLLGDLSELISPSRVIVVDGGSGDGTPELAESAGVRVLHSRPGRALQLNRGAWAADGDWLLFLHADSRLPAPARSALEQWLASPPRSETATFRFAVRERRWYGRILEVGQAARERISGLAYGDQGLLVSRRRFEAVGGYPQLPLMEDVEMIRRLRRHSGVARIDADLPTSLRRYDRAGPIRGWVRNALLMTLYLAGLPPRRLARFYPDGNGERGDATSRRTLLIFAKAPRPGTVKTRLARDIGTAEATRLYRSMGRSVVDGLRNGPWRTVVCFSPDEARPEMEDWLGTEGLEWLPQAGGDLGARMHAAIREAFAMPQRPAGVCVVGTDTPDLGPDEVHDAFRRLEGGQDVVIGPAEDGGYYLIGVRAPRAELFRGIDWSTERVLAQTGDRIRTQGLRTSELDVLNDIDELADLRASGL
ncbi:MAG: DUF2064 domain-containing protein [Gemmatimonadales bacterium]|nr:MAG: DUF2064 domain-containing protein [Gemmatimonadales bacterium]